MFTVGGLFSGIGGIESGYKKAGFKILWSNENDPYSARSFRHNYNHMKDTVSFGKGDCQQVSTQEECGS